MKEIIEFIKKTPKVELHLHIEGTLEPDLLFKLAKRNNIEIPFANINEVKSAYNFNNGWPTYIQLPELSTQLGLPNSSATISVWFRDLGPSNYCGGILLNSGIPGSQYIFGRIQKCTGNPDYMYIYHRIVYIYHRIHIFVYGPIYIHIYMIYFLLFLSFHMICYFCLTKICILLTKPCLLSFQLTNILFC